MYRAKDIVCYAADDRLECGFNLSDDRGLNEAYVYGEPLCIWTLDHDDPIVPAHYVEIKDMNSSTIMFIVNWEGRFLELNASRIRRIERFNHEKFVRVMFAGDNIPPLKKNDN